VDGAREFYKLRVSMPLVGSSTTLGYSKNSVRIPVPLNTIGQERTEGFVYKYAPDGRVLWSARIACSGTGGNQGPSPFASVTDSTGAVYVVGRGFWGGTDAIADQNLFYNADGSLAAIVTVPVRGENAPPFCAKYNANGFYQWSVSVVTTNAPSRSPAANGIAVDSSDNIYFTGRVSGDAGGNMTAYNVDGTTLAINWTPSGEQGDVFLVKYNSSGFAQWLTRLSCPDTVDSGRGVAVDSTGVYIVGDWGSGSITAYNANGTAFGTTLTRDGSRDIFIAKYTLTGSVSWFTRISSTSNEEGNAVAVDSAGDLVVTGHVRSTLVTAYNSDGTAFGTTLATSGLQDAFVAKYSGAGNVQWFAKMGGTAVDIGNSITTDSGNNVYVAGYHATGSIFTAYNSDGSAFGTTLPSRASSSGFIVKYNSTGSVQWVAQMELGLVYAITADTSDNIYAALRSFPGLVVYNSDGTTFAAVTITTSPGTCIVTYNSSGFAQRTRVINLSSFTRTVCRDGANNIFIGGQFSEHVAQNRGPSTTVAFAISGPQRSTFDGSVVKYRANGSPWWAARIASVHTASVNAVATDSSGNIYVTGGFGGPGGNLTTGGRPYNADGTGFGAEDIFVLNRAFLVKYNPVGVVQWGIWFTAASGKSIAVDSDGNVYVGGQGIISNNRLTAGSSDGGFISQDTTAVLPGMLVKWNTNGIAQWIARTGSSATFNGVAVDSSGNVFAFGNGPGNIFNANGTLFGNRNGAVVIKYNSSGSVQWAGGMGTTWSEIRAIACDASGSVYVAAPGGSTTSGMGVLDGNGTLSVSLPVTAGSGDVGLAKYNSAGVVQWATRVASSDFDVPQALEVDPAGNLYMAGYSGTDQSTGTTPVLFYNANGTLANTQGVAKNTYVAWLVKYSPSGVVQWNIGISGGAANVPSGVTTDRRGDVYIGGGMNMGGVGTRRGVINDLGAMRGIVSPSSFSIVKFTPFGLLQWHQTLGIGRGSVSADSEASGIATDPDCNVIVSSGAGDNTRIFTRA